MLSDNSAAGARTYPSTSSNGASTRPLNDPVPAYGRPLRRGHRCRLDDDHGHGGRGDVPAAVVHLNGETVGLHRRVGAVPGIRGVDEVDDVAAGVPRPSMFGSDRHHRAMGRLGEGECVVVAPVRRIHHEHDLPGRQERRSGEGVELRDVERSARPTRARLRSPGHTGRTVECRDVDRMHRRRDDHPDAIVEPDGEAVRRRGFAAASRSSGR